MKGKKMPGHVVVVVGDDEKEQKWCTWVGKWGARVCPFAYFL